MTKVTIHLYDNGTLDTWTQEDDGPTISFDPTQLPDQMAEVMGKVTVQALARVADLEAAQSKVAEALTEG